jgi:riboflavin kinase / FMN adenylyltransferase
MLRGAIVHGDGLGKKLGYPTANIDCDKSEVHLGPGVYAAIATLDNKKYIAALVIMSKPPKVEAHLVEYEGPDVYGKYLTIEPVQKVGTISKFYTNDELKEKIAEDIALVKEVFDDPE